MAYKVTAENELGAIGATKDDLREAVVQAEGWVAIGLKNVLIRDAAGNLVWPKSDA